MKALTYIAKHVGSVYAKTEIKTKFNSAVFRRVVQPFCKSYKLINCFVAAIPVYIEIPIQYVTLITVITFMKYSHFY